MESISQLYLYCLNLTEPTNYLFDLDPSDTANNLESRMVGNNLLAQDDELER